jgi:hypothetical protein
MWGEAASIVMCRAPSLVRIVAVLLAACAVAVAGLRTTASAQSSDVPSPSPTPSDPCAEDRLLATANRPTIGYSACAVKRDTVVFELGYQNSVQGTPRNGSIDSQVPQAFTRVGVAPRFELDVIGPNYEAERSYTPNSNVVRNGVDDSGFGFKYEFVPNGSWTVAVDGLYTAPNGSAFLTAGGASYTGNLDVAYSLSSATSIGTTVAVESTGRLTGGRRAGYGVTQPSLVMTTKIPNQYQFYAEYVLVSKIAPGEGARDFTDFGVQKLLGTRTEVDVEYGHAFTGIGALKFDYIGAGTVVQLW